MPKIDRSSLSSSIVFVDVAYAYIVPRFIPSIFTIPYTTICLKFGPDKPARANMGDNEDSELHLSSSYDPFGLPCICLAQLTTLEFNESLRRHATLAARPGSDIE